MYDIHVYTAAIKTYADVVVRIIDPDGSIIGRKAVAKEMYEALPAMFFFSSFSCYSTYTFVLAVLWTIRRL